MIVLLHVGGSDGSCCFGGQEVITVIKMAEKNTTNI